MSNYSPLKPPPIQREDLNDGCRVLPDRTGWRSCPTLHSEAAANDDVVHNDHAVNNAGAILSMDIVAPVVVIALLLALRAVRDREPSAAPVPRVAT
jgi:hypothetical protein